MSEVLGWKFQLATFVPPCPQNPTQQKLNSWFHKLIQKHWNVLLDFTLNGNKVTHEHVFPALFCSLKQKLLLLYCESPSNLQRWLKLVRCMGNAKLSIGVYKCIEGGYWGWMHLWAGARTCSWLVGTHLIPPFTSVMIQISISLYYISLLSAMIQISMTKLA